MYDIIISGYYGFGNSGDDAILMALINDLRMLKNDVKILVLSMNPNETKKIYKVDAISRINIIKICIAMRQAKLFISGGGSLIQDITSTRSLFYYLGLIKMAKNSGMKIMVYANGIGPLNKKINRIITQKILDYVNVITLRDCDSRKEIDAIGITKPDIRVTADPVFTLNCNMELDLKKALGDEFNATNAQIVGFSLRKWEGNEKYENVIAALADYMIEKYSITPIFLPMEYPKDIYISECVMAKMKGKAYIVRKNMGVINTMALVKKMEIMIGMRLHSLIYATNSGVPVVGLVYEPKVEGLLKDIGQASAGNVSKLEFEKIKAIVDDIWIRRASIRNDINRISKELRENAHKNAEIAVSLLNAGGQ